ncbi:hypothetical protein, partial [Kribbella deserti]
LSTYLYTDANPINLTDPDGRNPDASGASAKRTPIAAGGGSSPTAGKITVKVYVHADNRGRYFDPVDQGFYSVNTNVNGKVVATTVDGGVVRSMSPDTPAIFETQVDVPDVEAAQRSQSGQIGRTTGRSNPGHVAEILHAGGAKQVPSTGGGMVGYLKKLDDANWAAQSAQVKQSIVASRSQGGTPGGRTPQGGFATPEMKLSIAFLAIAIYVSYGPVKDGFENPSPRFGHAEGILNAAGAVIGSPSIGTAVIRGSAPQRALANGSSPSSIGMCAMFRCSGLR